ncbi:hypothetical protein HID58_079775 [Brassica napus]|uniref:Aconitase/3-isopropylmalate dehydratase large subunit alpha/beta/alpha domain-containing protein n=1 Tax=Brassica napus TaxID=3708 RepID=A0ABQ7Y2Z8_BRANA|nr:hypothetical protein HID58_079775 [Brassica napus]
MASSVISSSPFLCKSAQKDLGFPKSSQISVHRCQKRAISRKIVSVMAPQRSSSATGSVKTGMTMTEKILAKAAEKSQVVPGDNIWVNVDVLMTHDVCGPGAFGIFKREFGEKAKVWDPEKIVVIPDHYIFTTDKRVCHVALAQEGHCRPGEVLLGTDSHTCTAGAFGQFATGIGNTDAGFVLGTGKILLKVPPTMRFILDGEMPSYLQAKDLILQVSVLSLLQHLSPFTASELLTGPFGHMSEIIGEISVAGATYKTMEFSGTTIESLTMEERMTLCNMVVEAGGKNGVIPPDATTFNYVENRTSVPFEPVYSDGNARYDHYRFDVSKLEPVVAKPHSPDNRALARECKDVKIDRVYIGSCTGGKTEDFMAAAKLFHAAGKQVKVPTFLVPATQKVWMDVYALPVPGAGGKTCAQIFEEAGCDTPTSPSCGACLGGPADTYARLNEPQVCVSTTNRNFPGRMGHKEGQIYLVSPYTAAASALTGHVTDPREFLQ